MAAPLTLTPTQRETHLRWLLEVSSLPAAAGKESRVIAWINRWLAGRPDLVCTPDAHGNLTIASKREPRSDLRPVYFTAHMDHPAFVVERIIAPDVVEVSFRGGVMDDYFREAPIVIHDSQGKQHQASLFGDPKPGEKPSTFKHYMVELAHPTREIAIGDVGVWDVGPAEIKDGIVHTLACDDLSALAAAVAAFDSLPFDQLTQPVRLLFTRAEEIGFVGAIGACREKTMPMNARVIALENSRSFAESPIGGGPIVRVGDRISIFSPTLTEAIAKRAEEIAGGASTVTASQKLSDLPAWKWQRKLMAGGACEASVYCAFGYEATCVCLPLGNYHNMAHLDDVQAGVYVGQPRAAREFNAVSDYEGLVDLLIACGLYLPDTPPFAGPLKRFDKLWGDLNWVL
jgi:putative aminopeptidase FrvX